MITLEEAMQIAQKTITKLAIDSKIDILISEKIVFDEGWAFFYNSKEFLEKGDKMWRLLGNNPFIVDKLDGAVYLLSIDYLIGDVDSPEHWNQMTKQEREKHYKD